jgi:type II secretory pathway component GspD/PulD (secretin)
MKFSKGIIAVVLAALSGPIPWAQIAPAAAKAGSEANAANPASGVTARTFYLKNVTQSSDANELYTALRNMLDAHVKSYLVPSQSAIIVQGTPEQLLLAQNLLNDLDRPRKTYRLTYTVTEMDGKKPISTQHFAMVVASGQKTTLRQNSRVPVATGPSGSSGVQTQFTYMDVGMNFEATLDESVTRARLRTNVDRTGVAEETADTMQQPVIRHFSLEGASFLTARKPLMLGSVDVPGGTRRLDVEVMMEPLP